MSFPHVDLHAEKVKSLVRHAEFRPWLAAASRRIMRALSAAQPGGTVNIVTYCRKGAHRSVSAAVALQRVLEFNVSGIMMRPIKHYSKEHLWPRNYCGECKGVLPAQERFLGCLALSLRLCV